MHRSGTSLVAGVLRSLGVYMGPALSMPDEAAPDEALLLRDGYGEAADFFVMNERLLAAAGSTWYRVDPFLARRDTRPFETAALALLTGSTFGRLRTRHLRHLPAEAARDWGWKDPRNSLTLPYWLRLFPQARVIHVVRSRDAAADSLHRRALAWRQGPASAPQLPLRARLERALRNPAAAAATVARRCGLLPLREPAPDPCLSLEYCRDLCDTYLRECYRFRSHGGDCLEVHYEELLAEPAAVVRQIASQVRRELSEAELLAAAALVRRSTPSAAAPPAAVPAPQRDAGPSPAPALERGALPRSRSGCAVRSR
jgi:hypothetical protein